MKLTLTGALAADEVNVDVETFVTCHYLIKARLFFNLLINSVITAKGD
jgi:hypothetical protein